MRTQVLLSLVAATALAQDAVITDMFNPNNASSISARNVQARNALVTRQDIDFDLIDSTPDPTVAADNSTNYNQAAAIASAVAEVIADPLAQTVSRKSKRDIQVSTYPGYTANIALGNAAINAPLDCAGTDTYMGVKIFTSGPFDTTLCAAACSAQSDYNRKHPPASGKPKQCAFYQTYASYKNGKYQGQYCAMYTAAWDVKYATNKGQSRGSDVYTIQNSYIATNATSDGVNHCINARGCNNPYWGNSVSCGVRTSDDNDICWCNKGIDGVGYCTHNEIDGRTCQSNDDCDGGVCMYYRSDLGICALGKRIAACNPGVPITAASGVF